MNTKVNLRAVSAHNTELVIDAIRDIGSISRVEIARQTGLSPTTVTSLLTPLLEQGIVQEKKETGFTGGRRSVLLELNRTFGFLVSAAILHAKIEIMVFDFSLTCVMQTAISLKQTVSHAECTDILKQSIGKFKRGTILGIGISVAGIVDSAKGLIVSCPALKKGGYRICEELGKTFPVLTRVENIERIKVLDVAAAFPNARTLLCFDVGEGIGAGLLVNGKVQHGAHYRAGEIGHTMIDPKGPKCTLGHCGCLESMANEHAILQVCKKAVGRLVKVNELDHLHATNKAVRKALSDKACLIAGVLSPLMDCLDPDVLALTGPVFEQSNAFFSLVCEQINLRSFATQTQPAPRIVRHDFSWDVIALELARLLWQETRSSNKDHSVSA